MTTALCPTRQQRSSVHGDFHETTPERIGCLNQRECVAIQNDKDTETGQDVTMSHESVDFTTTLDQSSHK